MDLARSLEKLVRISEKDCDGDPDEPGSVYCRTLLSMRPNTLAMRFDLGVACKDEKLGREEMKRSLCVGMSARCNSTVSELTVDGDRAGVLVAGTPKSFVRSTDAADIRRRFVENAFVTDSGVHVRFLFFGVASDRDDGPPSMSVWEVKDEKNRSRAVS